ncbi:methyltransferase domain-containing protein [Amycolatopsis sp. cg5]|uniref:class I SAM-dependent methyltransferase n=1 Tax=Amycolatopsis sp. cg5 TaxID=3238802 RepID=UPI0035252826
MADLCAGCGSGPLFAALRDRGALVSGFDQSTGMIDMARRRLGADADLRVADLAELRRVLKPGGRLILSVDHPMANHLLHRMSGRRPDYFEPFKRDEEWDMGGHTARLSFWERPRVRRIPTTSTCSTRSRSSCSSCCTPGESLGRVSP